MPEGDQPVARLVRRRFVQGLGAVGASGSFAPLLVRAGAPGSDRAGHDARVAMTPAGPMPLLAATWLQGSRHYVGLMRPGEHGIEVAGAVALPSRAHAVIPQPDGRVLVVARRPGDWLARIDVSGRREPQWCWSDGSTCFNGHVIATADGKRLLASETDLESGEGLLGVYEARTLELVDRWPVEGIDPHQMIEGRDGALWVAVGGIEIRRETGRLKYGLDRMDSCLVRLDAATGEIRQRWHLPDSRLGLRHLAETADGRIGIALQAEHADPEARRRAPVLAVLDRVEGIHAIGLPDGVSGAGYGGSIVAAGKRLLVSCPRVGRVMQWELPRVSGDGRAGWLAPIELPEACPLAVQTLAGEAGESGSASGTRTAAGTLQQIWAGGAGAVVAETRPAIPPASRSGPVKGPDAPPQTRHALDATYRLDNHWSVMPG
ncbi:MAG: DUF1513 domain-containing protein [Lautropia sp.]|nr:DUF1513 domain-containing protein [Lautropia sp.]